jgi:hypothetical protein
MNTSSVGPQTDQLYQLPLDAFTAARNALAKTLTGDAARQVKALRKPSAVAWAVNQLFWKSRAAYDALMKAGGALRGSQIAALKGRKADVRAAMEAHRRALAKAVERATTISSDAGVNPGADSLARMLEALSLAPAPVSGAGRYIDVVQPSGFAALAGVKPAAPPPSVEAAKARKAREAEKQARETEARLNAAEDVLSRAQSRAEAARRALNRAEADVADAERAVEAARARVLPSSR